MAVPGSPLDPRAQGCNHLIREGAVLVQNADDILEVIQMFNRGFEQSVERYIPDHLSADPNDRERANLTALLSPVPVPVDELIRQSGFSAPLFYAILLELELIGRLERHAGGRVSLI
jgi:DNA processing protein